MVAKDPIKLQKIFNKHDIDNSKTISTSELSQALKELNVSVSNSRLLEIVEIYDSDLSGELSYKEFVSIFDEARLRSTFEEIDVDGSGTVSTNELSKAMKSLGYSLSESQIKKILMKVDTNNDGEINYKEYETFFANVPAANLESIAKLLMDQVSVDCGSDLSPPIPSPNVPWYYGVLGGIGGVVSRTLTAPLEKVKLVAQTTNDKQFSILGEMKKTYKSLGVRGLFAGNFANCLRVFPYAFIVTLVYLNTLKLTPADQELDAMEPIYRGSCAATAGVVGQLFTYPIDVVRAQLTVNAGKYKKGIIATGRSIAKEGGTFALYRGLTPTLLAVTPFLAFQMSTADAIKSIMSEKDIELTTPRMMLVGGTAGVVAQSFVYPLDVLRRRMQVAGGVGSAGNAAVC